MATPTAFSIFVKGIGTTSKTIKDILPTTTVTQIKQKIMDQECVPVKRQQLIAFSKPMKDEHNGKELTAGHYNLQEGSTIQLVFRVLGGISVKVKLLAVGADNAQKQLTVELNPSETVSAFKERIATMDTNLSADKMNLNFAGIVMEDGNSMSSYFAKFDAKDEIMIEQTKGSLKAGDGLVISYKECCLGFDDDQTTSKAEMPCGHVISVEGMTLFMRSQLENNIIYQILCPAKKPNGQNCQEPWAYELCREVGVFTQEECKEFEGKIGRNYAKKECDMQECPKCSSYLMRETEELKTICGYCQMQKQGHPFCWTCKRKWNGFDRTKCGYPDCENGDATEILQKCATKTISFGVNVSGVPIYRRCPFCSNVIEHTDKCKHMTCPCKGKFCFVCLKKMVDGRWQCGSYNTTCSVAPRQS